MTTATRALGRAVSCLFFAVSIPVVVAWSCALAADFDSPGEVQLVAPKGESTPFVWVLGDLGTEMVLSEFKAELAAAILDVDVQAIEESRWDWSILRSHGFIDSRVYIEQASGWPWPCLKWQYRADQLEGAISFGEARVLSYDPAWTLDLSPIRQHVLPLQPVWTGLIGNFAIYAAAWLFVIYVAPSACRIVSRRSRKRRGCCPVCAYNLCGDLDGGCPECGWGRVQV